MSFGIILRLFLVVIFALLGWWFGSAFLERLPVLGPIGGRSYPFIIAFLGALVGFVLSFLFLWIWRSFLKGVQKVSARSLLMGTVGAVLGLFVGLLLAFPLSLLPGLWGRISPLVGALLLACLGGATLVMREQDILTVLGLLVGREGLRLRRDVVLLDTSVIIDGRVIDIHRAGFIGGTLLVPRFVLDELQHIADSSDVLRRNRGRRGLDILNKMQKDESIPLEITDMDVPGISTVDGKLIKLAQELNCPILTNDYNLNRVAELQGVRVLNINELANAVKPVVLPGETLRVQIIQEGKEPGQGVGYLDDGTMVVVEEGRRHMNAMVSIVVTRVLQTVAGRMIFGQIHEDERTT